MNDPQPLTWPDYAILCIGFVDVGALLVVLLIGAIR